MIALDTNVVVRLVMNDDPAQTRRARNLLEARTALILPTVLLETEWVLRGAYEIERAAIAGAIRKLLGRRNIAVGNAEAVAHALEERLKKLKARRRARPLAERKIAAICKAVE